MNMLEHISVVGLLRIFLFLPILISACVEALCYERKYNNTKQCVDCPGHCIYCNSSECYQCDNGYFGTNCTQQCTNCKPDTKCEKNDGFCLEGCRDGLSGHYCKEQCDSRCSSCTRNDATKCIKCRGNLSCELFCPDDCYCDGNRCANGCAPGYWGERCEFRCPEHCSAEKSNTDVYLLAVPVLSMLVLIMVAVVLGMFCWKRRRPKHKDSHVVMYRPQNITRRLRTSQMDHSDISSNFNDNFVDNVDNYDHVAREAKTSSAEWQAEEPDQEFMYAYAKPFPKSKSKQQEEKEQLHNRSPAVLPKPNQGRARLNKASENHYA